MILLCCTDVVAARQAEATVRASGILQMEKYKGFSLGITDLPLEHPGPIRRLPNLPRPPTPGPRRPYSPFPPPISPCLTPDTSPAWGPSPSPQPQPPSLSLSLSPYPSQSLKIVGCKSLDNQGSSGSETRAIAVFALSSKPQIGRRIFTAESSTGPVHFATAGIIINVGGDFYQLTVGHLFELEDDAPDAGLPGSSGYCYFDGQSDDEDCDLDQGSEIASNDSDTSGNTESCDELLPQSTAESLSGYLVSRVKLGH
ncbi:hypothetical protein F5Y09DRAFT_321441 [Xylaria sp. FL1042]|nr:hypothetical protein F5Y09DRAFT_321441 [Xylaria sp. FL1042]